MIRKPKTVHDVRGDKIRCVNFQKCPLCYGCRRYSSSDPECQKCLAESKKKNICNVELHKADVTSKMITKEVITFKEPISFESL